VKRPFTHPFGLAGIWVSTILITFWVVLGSWVAIFPDTLEKLFGVGYGFKDTWGVTRATFELLTLGTLLVIILVGAVGYLAGTKVRSHTATVEIGEAAVTA
jgi:hypothetical protein